MGNAGKCTVIEGHDLAVAVSFQPWGPNTLVCKIFLGQCKYLLQICLRELENAHGRRKL